MPQTTLQKHSRKAMDRPDFNVGSRFLFICRHAEPFPH
jgi:hypothetical protein